MFPLVPAMSNGLNEGQQWVLLFQLCLFVYLFWVVYVLIALEYRKWRPHTLACIIHWAPSSFIGCIRINCPNGSGLFCDIVILTWYGMWNWCVDTKSVVDLQEWSEYMISYVIFLLPMPQFQTQQTDLIWIDCLIVVFYHDSHVLNSATIKSLTTIKSETLSINAIYSIFVWNYFQSKRNISSY